MTDTPSIPVPAEEPDDRGTADSEQEPADLVAQTAAPKSEAASAGTKAAAEATARVGPKPEAAATAPKPEAESVASEAARPGAAARASAASSPYRKQPQGPPPAPDWQQWQPQRPEPPAWLTAISPTAPARIRVATLWSVLATALLSALLLGEGAGLNLLIVTVPAALAAYFAAQAAGRRPRPWTLVWALGGAALLVVPALSDAGLPTFLAITTAMALGSLALHGARTWPGVVFGPFGLLGSIGTAMAWALRGLRERAGQSRRHWLPVIRALVVAVVLLVVFGSLFAGADAAFADLLGGLTPEVSVEDGPWRFLLFGVGLLGALAAAHTAAAPLRWDRVTVRPGKARARMEWALPLIVLNLLFAAFIAVQLAVLFGGYRKVFEQTGLTRSEYARQGFWQLLWVTVLVLLVIGLARRWAPRDGARDRALVRTVLGVLCVLTLIVTASALRRMDLYVEAYGLTRLRVTVAAMELWLALVIVLILVAGAVGGRWLPRAVAASAAAAVLVYGLLSPDGLVAEQNVQRYERTEKIDVEYFQELSADAVPALDRLPEPLRSCALTGIDQNLSEGDQPWYATSLAERRARDILAERPVDHSVTCAGWGYFDDYRGDFDGL
ncbi:DUF4153 domain-containing protein [Streptomyces sp. GMY02]|uniref:DUF4153 domain-containing protein n=1 Tax=Streptomyces sp. GMY02 TaxID=1333528 RepID=UPI0020B820A0|nr:DUF4173 domain-containing protein [Streptomyces sp. GMY02]